MQTDREITIEKSTDDSTEEQVSEQCFLEKQSH